MIVHIKETAKGKQANLYITEIVFSLAFQNSTFQRHRMKKNSQLEDNILIFRQVFVKMYLLLYLLMDNELVFLCSSMIKVEENYATEFYYPSLLWRY